MLHKQANKLGSHNSLLQGFSLIKLLLSLFCLPSRLHMSDLSDTPTRCGIKNYV